MGDSLSGQRLASDEGSEAPVYSPSIFRDSPPNHAKMSAIGTPAAAAHSIANISPSILWIPVYQRTAPDIACQNSKRNFIGGDIEYGED